MFGKHDIYKSLLFIVLTFKKIYEIVRRKERKKYIRNMSKFQL